MEPHQTALPIVFGLPEPSDDAGALTQSRYHFQTEVTTRWCYGLLDPDGPLAVICEHHEDFLVVHANGVVDLVSVKHREPNRGVWSLPELCDDGGLTHLFDRWSAVRAGGRPIRAMLITNGGLRTGSRQPAELDALCQAVQRAQVAWMLWAKLLARQFLLIRQRRPFDGIPERVPPARADILDEEDDLVRLVARFLEVLTICRVPHRDDIAATTIMEVVVPLFRRNGWDERHAATSHEAVVGLVDKTARSFGARRVDLARKIATLDQWPAMAERHELIASRLLDADRIRAALVLAGDVPLYPVGVEPGLAPGGGRLRRKMTSAGLSAVQHEYADRLRAAWYATRRHRLPDLPGDAAIVSQIEVEVLDLVLDAQASLDRGDPRYAATLFDTLRRTVRASAFRQSAPLPMNDHHALGVAFELCDQCNFDFGSPVDGTSTTEVPA